MPRHAVNDLLKPANIVSGRRDRGCAAGLARAHEAALLHRTGASGCGDMLSRLSAGLPTNIASAAALGCAGDVACQLGAERRPLEALDTRRVAALSIFNAAYIGGFLHYLYQGYPVAVRAFSRKFRPRLAESLANERSFSHAIGCACVDNVHNGALYTPAFFLGVGLLQGETLDMAMSTLRREWAETYAWCTAFWLPFTAFNYKVVPPKWRVRAMASANLVWCVGIDFLAHRG
mgnify:FL=1